jgi:hypothetical protein
MVRTVMIFPDSLSRFQKRLVRVTQCFSKQSTGVLTRMGFLAIQSDPQRLRH